MKIIMLEGPSHSGKTTTLNMVYDTLTASCGAVVESPRVPVPPASTKDFEAVLRYNDKHIAIHSSGDIQWECVAAIVKYSGQDVLILACNDKFTHLPQIVAANAPPHTVPHTVLNKTLATPPLTEAAANTQDCNTVIGLL